MEKDKIIAAAVCTPCCDTPPTVPTSMQYAYAYIKFQSYGNVFSPEASLTNGTYFKDLNMPYTPWKKGAKNGCTD